MRRLYAFLVGIDRYRSDRIRDLAGCGNDIRAASAFLRARTEDADNRLRLLTRCDEEATRAAVVDGLATHLGQAGPGDSALFWFSGHGSQAPVPPEFRAIEAGELMQTLVCADSRTGGVPDLLDKELSVLLDEIAVRDVHVTVVLDSCHAAGATRKGLEETEPAVRVRAVDPMSRVETPGLLLPELGGRTADRVGRSGAEHVALAAARRFEPAEELLLDDEQRGLFSWALLKALARPGPVASYRRLLVAARVETELRASRQVPQLSPNVPGLADQPFLGGEVVTSRTGMTMRYARQGWEVDAGRCHGLPPTCTDGDLRVAVAGRTPVREARVVRVLAERSLLDPVGWEPGHQEQYPVVLSGLPFPRTTVEVGGAPREDPVVTARIVQALHTAGPGGGPSPHLRILDAENRREKPELRVRIPAPGVVRVEDATGTPIGDDLVGVPGDGARPLVERLEHVAQWRQVHGLSNPSSGLDGLVTMDLTMVPPGALRAGPDDPVIAAEEGEIRLRYRWDGARWVPPRVFVRLTNHAHRRLFCMLLNLTGRYRIHADLLPGEFVDARSAAWARRGRPVEVTLPAGEPPEPGRAGRDWLKLVVAEQEFAPDPFELPALDGSRPSTRTPLALRGLLDRLGRAAVDRDMHDAAPDEASDWWTLTLPVSTRVPEPRPAGGETRLAAG